MLVFWHFDRNMEVSPEEVGIYSKRKVWWRHVCPTIGKEHEWQATVGHTYICHTCNMRDWGEENTANPAQSVGNALGRSSCKSSTSRPARACQHPE